MRIVRAPWHMAMISLFVLLGTLATLHAADWPMLGRDVTRNSVSPEENPPLDWDIQTGRNIRWTAQLGSMTHGTPVIADGQVYIGTNNGAGYLDRYPSKVDLGVLLCFRESNGEFLWQYSAEKLPAGRVHDWPVQGIGSSPLVEGDRLWFVSNRWEVVCLDTQGFRDGENDGPFTDESAQADNEADVVWTFDMMKELGVFPHNQGMGPTRRSSPAASYKNRIYVVTGNGVDNSHVNIPAPDAPSLVCLDKRTGKPLWADSSPGANVLNGEFSSPLVAEIGGWAQVIIPQGDGWIRSLDAISGELIWKFDVNHKEARWQIGGNGNRNHVLATPVLYDNRIYVASGHEAEHGEGLGRLVCIDPTKTGDISSELAVDTSGEVIPHRRIRAVNPEQGERAIPNPNSGLIWEFTSEGDQWEGEMHRTMATVAIDDGFLVLPDFSGLVHCFDAGTGKRLWYYDCFAQVWSTPLIVDGHVYVCDEDGEVAILNVSADTDAERGEKAVEREPLAVFDVGGSIIASPVFANGTLYVPTRSMLYAIANDEPQAVKTTEEFPAGNWPQWRGPQRNNLSTETGLLQQWPDGGPPLVWRADGLGEGIASASIGGGRIVTICQHEETEYVRALDEASGVHLWTARLGTAIRQSRLMRWLTQRAPTIDRDRLIVVSLLGEVVCLRAEDGAELWRRSYTDDFGGRPPTFGYSDCPVVEGQVAICTPGGPEASVVGLHRETGETVWTCAVREGGAAPHTTGVIAEVAGMRQFVTFLQNAIVGIDVSNGNVLWRDGSPEDRYFRPNSPIVHGNDIVLINGNRRAPAQRLHVSRGLDGFDVQQLWSNSAGRFDRFHENAFLVEDQIYEISPVATCLDAMTGDVVWQKRTFRRPASATWADDRFYIHTSGGLMKLYEANPNGCDETGSFALADHQEMSGATAPVVAGGRLYIREDGRLFCYDIRQHSSGITPPQQRVSIPELATLANQNESVDRASDPRRIVNSVFTPTPQDVVAQMLELAAVRKDDVVFDLGSGDGRIVITAARSYGCRAVGYEIDGQLVKDSQAAAVKAGVDELVTFHRADLFTADLKEADVITLYLLPIQNQRLIPTFKNLHPGTRIVTHQFDIPGIVADRVIHFESEDSSESHKLSLYTVPLTEAEAEER